LRRLTFPVLIAEGTAKGTWANIQSVLPAAAAAVDWDALLGHTGPEIDFKVALVLHGQGGLNRLGGLRAERAMGENEFARHVPLQVSENHRQSI